MKQKRILTIAFCVFLCLQLTAQEMDQQISQLATNLASLTKSSGKKKVTVLDFTDLQGNSTELGKYIAEQLTVDLVTAKKDFSVVDRANLRKIMAEHKLTAEGLIDPANAKKLGQFAGVDAIILGTLTPRGQKVVVTAKIISTETAEIEGAGKCEFKSDENIQQLLSQVSNQGSSTGGEEKPVKPSPSASKKFGDLQMDLQSLRIVNGEYYLLTATFTNLNSSKPISIAFKADAGTLIDPENYEFPAEAASGLEVGRHINYLGYDGRVTKLQPKESVTATLSFRGRPGRAPMPGKCSIRFCVFTLDVDGYGKVSGEKENNVVVDMKTN